MALFFRDIAQRFRSTKSTPQCRRPKPRQKMAIPAYILLVDQSASTGSNFRLGKGTSLSRIAAIQRAAHGYLTHLAKTNHRQPTGLVGFSEQAHLYHAPMPVGQSLKSLQAALRSLRPQGRTNISAGLELALQQLRKIGAMRGNIVLISDGAANLRAEHLGGLIQKAHTRRVRIFTIGVGNLSDCDYDKPLLVRMANNTGGRFMCADDFSSLCSALRMAC